MRHDWVFDVLKDLLSYARLHDLPALAAQVEMSLAVAQAEIAAERDKGEPAAGACRPAGSIRGH
ncbi:MAG: hypothetical protein R3D63_11015 [Paracoccaceae bacterium]